MDKKNESKNERLQLATQIKREPNPTVKKVRTVPKKTTSYKQCPNKRSKTSKKRTKSRKHLTNPQRSSKISYDSKTIYKSNAKNDNQLFGAKWHYLE